MDVLPAESGRARGGGSRHARSGVPRASVWDSQTCRTRSARHATAARAEEAGRATAHGGGGADGAPTTAEVQASIWELDCEISE
eukprot:1056984-Prymnesium_polylepis.1